MNFSFTENGLVRMTIEDSDHEIIYDETIAPSDVIDVALNMICAARNADSYRSERNQQERMSRTLLNQIGHCHCGGQLNFRNEEDGSVTIFCDRDGEPIVRAVSFNLALSDLIDMNHLCIENHDDLKPIDGIPSDPGVYSYLNVDNPRRFGLSRSGIWYPLDGSSYVRILNQAKTSLSDGEIRSLPQLVRVRDLERFERGFLDDRKG